MYKRQMPRNYESTVCFNCESIESLPISLFEISVGQKP